MTTARFQHAIRSALVVVASVALGAGLVAACSQKDVGNLPPSKLGGKGSARELRERPLNQPARTLTNDGRRSFGTGATLFRDTAAFVNGGREDVIGLGPTFVDQSCVSCHVDGLNAGQPVKPDAEMPSGQPSPGLVVRLSGGPDTHGAPTPDPHFGLEIQPKAVEGVRPEGTLSTKWVASPFKLADGSTVERFAPKVTFTPDAGDWIPKVMSPRIATPLVGLSLLESIPQSDLERLADPNDSNGDGVSGEVQMVWDPIRSTKVVGRFGWKASQPTVRAQSAGAAAFDMGVTSSVQPSDCEQTPCLKGSVDASAGTPTDLDSRQLDELVLYTEAIAVPESQPLRQPTDEMRRGSALFESVGCSSCHTPKQTTGETHVPGQIVGETVHPYTDLLLHDMGPELADGRVESNASGSEWRTPPLWSMWLRNQIGFGRMMHDGRAGTIEQAILWHGGEGESARSAYSKLSKSDRDALVAFVQSL